MIISPGRTKTLAALLVNLSAGWFGLIFITPAISPTTLNFLGLTQALIL